MKLILLRTIYNISFNIIWTVKEKKTISNFLNRDLKVVYIEALRQRITCREGKATQLENFALDEVIFLDIVLKYFRCMWRLLYLEHFIMYMLNVCPLENELHTHYEIS